MPVQAQIVPDATLPSNSQVTANGSSFTIDGGTVRGSNHFHSFTEFSVPTGAEAFFNNGSAIDNIITRVTGGSISNINGLIRANGGANVNLFLLNPNGIVFGPNARLDIGGSFLGSTAESLLFEDGSFYSATNPEAPPLLTINVPLGLQLGPNSGSIRVQGPGHNLTQERFAVIRDNRPTGVAVAPGNSLTLVGAEVNLEGGNLTGIDGRVELGGVVEGRVGITPAGGLEYDGVRRFGDIRLSGAASIDASGAGGTVQLMGRHIQLREASVIVSNATGPVDSGPFSLRATESVEMVEGTETFPTGLFNQVEPEVTGNSGELTITTGQLMIADGAVVNNSTAGIGNTGSLQVTADVVEIRGQQGNVSGLYSQVLPLADGGNSGNITVETEKLSILDRGLISTATFGDGNAGDLIIRATESVELRGIGKEQIIAGVPARESSSIFSGGGASPTQNKLPDTVTGKAGNITIETGQLILADGAFILSSTARSQDGANLTIRATDSVILRGNNPSANPFLDTKSSFLSSGVDAARLPDGSPFQPRANGGNITIDTGSLILEDGAVISAETQGIGNAGNLSIRASEGVQLRGFDNEGQGSSMVTIVSEGAMGDAGVITIDTDRLMLTDRASISSETRGNGNSGNVIVRAQSLRADLGSQLSVSSEIPENFGAGTLEITAAKIELENEAGFLAETAAGDQGNINVESQDLRLRRDAFISTNATRTATGGNITINADTIVSLFNSDISANAIQGAGGNIFIRTSGIFLSPDSEITATSEFGVAGTVTIANPDADRAVGLLKLPEDPVDASSLLGKDFCEVSKNSSFIITGRGGIPINPGDYLTPDFGRVHLVDPAISDDAATSSSRVRPEVNRNRERPIIEATGFVRHPDGTIELVADVSASPPLLRPVNCHDLARDE